MSGKWENAVRNYNDEAGMIDGTGEAEPAKESSKLQLFWHELMRILGRPDFRKNPAKRNGSNPAETSETPVVTPEEREQRKQKILDALQEKLNSSPEIAQIFLGTDLGLDIRMYLESLSDPITFEDAKALIDSVITYSDGQYITVERTIIGFDVNEPKRGYVFSFAQTQRLESKLLQQEAEELYRQLESNLDYQEMIPGTQSVEYFFPGFKNYFVLGAVQERFMNKQWQIKDMRVVADGSYISLRRTINGLHTFNNHQPGGVC